LRLGELCRDEHLVVYAWALMPNHFHILARTGGQPLSASMRRLLTGYVVNFNRRHRRVGHLFQNRYKSIVCEEDPYLLELTRYIHLNPLRAGLVDDMAALNRCPWAGHSALMGEVAREWQEQGLVLLPTLLARVAAGEGVEALALRSGVRKRKVVQARKILCQAAVRRMGYSGAEVARFLGLTTSAVNRLVSQDEVPEVEGYIS
jgi:REP element-mobilizing transposase RayT